MLTPWRTLPTRRRDCDPGTTRRTVAPAHGALHPESLSFLPIEDREWRAPDTTMCKKNVEVILFQGQPTGPLEVHNCSEYLKMFYGSFVLKVQTFLAGSAITLSLSLSFQLHMAEPKRKFKKVKTQLN